MNAGEGKRNRAGLLAPLGLAVLVAGLVVEVQLLGHPRIRATNAPGWIGAAAGVALALAALRGSRSWWVRVCSGATVLVALGFAYGILYGTRVPTATSAARAERAPGFELVDHQGDAVSLSGLLAKGPVLLVFFRGAW